MKPTPQPTNIPPTIQTIIGNNATFAANTIGESGAGVYRVTSRDGVVRYLKIVPLHHHEPLSLERDKLVWLAGRVPVPEVLAYAEHESHAWLLMTALDGVHPFHDDAAWSPETRVRFLADVARQFHALPVADCPFERGLARQIALAEANVAAGRVREDDFNEENLGFSARDLLRQLHTARTSAAAEDLVVAHGDLYPVNIIANGETPQLQGYLDVGRMGVSDRYTDLALCVLAIGWHYEPHHVDLFFDHYGIERDATKLHLYQLLDEFF